MQPRRAGPRLAGPVALAAILVFGAWARASGFTRGSLWFDDAWTALPARVGLSTALRMVTTAPGYTVALRSWLRLGPAASWWAQLPAFVAGLCGIAAVFALLRWFRCWPPLAYVGALVVAASPVAIDYSTRVKQFGVDLLLACAVLWLLERWRRDPRPRDAVLLSIACAGAVVVSAATLVVVVPVAVVALLAALGEPARRRDAAVVVSVSALAVVGVWSVFLRRLSPRLDHGWTTRGYLLSTVSLHRALFSLEAMGTGLFHYLLGVPTGRPPTGQAITTAGVVVALLAAAALAAIVLPPIVDAVRRRGLPGPLLASSLCVVLAVVLALAARSPFGGGRTDEVLYPSLLLLAAGAVTWLVERGEAARRVALVGCVVAAAALVAVGATHRAAYPTTQLRPLAASLRTQERAGDAVVVDPWLTFTWAYDGLSPTAISFAPVPLPWSQGFHVVSRTPRTVVISTNYFFPDRAYSRLSSWTHRAWYVAATVGPQSPVPGRPNRLLTTPNYLYLRQLGWTPAGTYLTADHTEAVLLVYRPATASLGAAAPRRASTRSSSRDVTDASS